MTLDIRLSELETVETITDDVRLLEAGAKVCISDINQQEGEKALEELKERFGTGNVYFVACDVCNEEEFNNLFDKTEEFFKVSCVDLLANNAGVNTNLGWRKCMAINIISVMLGSEIAQERMRKAGKAGQVINTASMAGFAPGINEEMTPYTVSKHGVVALTRTMGKANTGVLHKCICPAWTETKLVLSAMEQDRKDDMSEHIKKSGGFMTPEHVAEGFYRLVTQCENGSALAVMKVLNFNTSSISNYFSRMSPTCSYPTTALPSSLSLSSCPSWCPGPSSLKL